MIGIGLSENEKLAHISAYTAAHNISHVIVISGDDAPLPTAAAKHVKYSDVIMYATFYPLLQEIASDTLLVINECLRTQNRYDLSYNCIRHYLNRTNHQLVFQQLPQIDSREDFMILFDFDTQSRWKRRKFDALLIADEAEVLIQESPIKFSRIDIKTSDKTRQRYEAEREELFATIGNRDPDNIPRQLHLVSSADKKAYIQQSVLPLFASNRMFVARNKRFNLDCVTSYNTVEKGIVYTLVDLPHRFIEFSDFIYQSGQLMSEVLVADLKVDHWYFNRYQEWSERIHETCSSLQ
jgi:hypothetical protein